MFLKTILKLEASIFIMLIQNIRFFQNYTFISSMIPMDLLFIYFYYKKNWKPSDPGLRNKYSKNLIISFHLCISVYPIFKIAHDFVKFRKLILLNKNILCSCMLVWLSSFISIVPPDLPQFAIDFNSLEEKK